MNVAEVVFRMHSDKWKDQQVPVHIAWPNGGSSVGLLNRISGTTQVYRLLDLEPRYPNNGTFVRGTGTELIFDGDRPVWVRPLLGRELAPDLFGELKLPKEDDGE